jgi:hypothetical protein
LNSWLPFGDKLLGRAQDSTRHLWKWECASWCSQEQGEIPPTTRGRGARTAAAKQVWGSWLSHGFSMGVAWLSMGSPTANILALWSVLRQVWGSASERRANLLQDRQVILRVFIRPFTHCD